MFKKNMLTANLSVSHGIHDFSPKMMVLYVQVKLMSHPAWAHLADLADMGMGQETVVVTRPGKTYKKTMEKSQFFNG